MPAEARVLSAELSAVDALLDDDRFRRRSCARSAGRRWRAGAEGRISHLKRRYGLRRSRLKGHDGMRIWTWAILTYDLDTLAIRTR